jgi:hypothetical protein
MLGVDRPVGRLVDELAFEDNWRIFFETPSLPLLILHGDLDKEVPVSQVKFWVDHLPRNRVNIIIGRGYDHRYMPQGEYNPILVVQEIIAWLDRLFPMGKNNGHALKSTSIPM